MTAPSVSIIIPCHNNEATLYQTLKSLQMQTYNDWEAIVVNDGSTDGSAKAIRYVEERDSRFSSIYQENRGLPAARNAGIAAARGEFINFLDADDILLSKMLENSVKRLKNDSELCAVVCDWIFSDSELSDLTWTAHSPFEGKLFEKLAHQNLFPCHSVLLRRKILADVGDFDCSLRHCHDWDLWLRIARSGALFGRIKRPLVIYRMTTSSLSRNPLTFFEAEKEIVKRGHNEDPRVKKVSPKLRYGCPCSMKKAILERLLFNVGIAITQGAVEEASKLFEKTLATEVIDIRPRDIKLMTYSLWFGSATPYGDWDGFCNTTGLSLLQFLLRQEEVLCMPGFAMQSIMELIGWNEHRRKSHTTSQQPRTLFGMARKKKSRLILALEGRFKRPRKSLPGALSGIRGWFFGKHSGPK